MLKSELVAISDITLGDRQRKEYKNIDTMAESLRDRGQLQPIVITQNKLLVAGGRRLRAATMLGWTHIWAAYRETLSEHELQLLELEENVRREDLNWWEEALAIERYHRAREALDPEWTMVKTGEALMISKTKVSDTLKLARGFAEEPEKMKEFANLTAATNYMDRKDQRVISSELSRLLDTESIEDEDEEEGGEPRALDGVSHAPASPPSAPSIEFKKSPSRFRVACGDFFEFAASASGKIRYNFLHCDFPYGVGMDTSALQGTSERHDRYEDTPELYWRLCNALTQAQELLCQPSCHMMFWFSMKFYNETKTHFESAGWTVNPHPLVWLKSDGKGIIPDPTRGPRQVVETALLCSRGDRKIVRPVANGVAIPSGKGDALHLSEKPVEVLEHFFRMFVDESTELLDPTCGAGSALVAALNSGASRAFGLELNETYANHARNRVQEALLEPEPLKLKDLDLNLGSLSSVLA